MFHPVLHVYTSAYDVRTRRRERGVYVSLMRQVYYYILLLTRAVQKPHQKMTTVIGLCFLRYGHMIWSSY